MSMEVITTTDKAARDRMYEDLRANGNELERQVVKFSGNEPVLDADGKQDGQLIVYGLDYERTFILNGNKFRRGSKLQWRPAFRSTWSVAYPSN